MFLCCYKNAGENHNLKIAYRSLKQIGNVQIFGNDSNKSQLYSWRNAEYYWILWWWSNHEEWDGKVHTGFQLENAMRSPEALWHTCEDNFKIDLK